MVISAGCSGLRIPAAMSLACRRFSFSSRLALFSALASPQISSATSTGEYPSRRPDRFRSLAPKYAKTDPKMKGPRRSRNSPKPGTRKTPRKTRTQGRSRVQAMRGWRGAMVIESHRKEGAVANVGRRSGRGERTRPSKVPCTKL